MITTEFPDAVALLAACNCLDVAKSIHGTAKPVTRNTTMFACLPGPGYAELLRRLHLHRLYRTLDGLLKAKEAVENDLKDRLGTLFKLEYDVLETGFGTPSVSGGTWPSLRTWYRAGRVPKPGSARSQKRGGR